MILLTRRSLLISVVTLLVLAVAVPYAFAIASGPPTEDASTYVNHNTLTTNDDRLRVEAGTPNCQASPTRYSFLKWNLSDISKTIGSATMTFRVQSVSLGSTDAGQTNIVLYETTDLWSETGETDINWSNQPTLGDPIGSVVVPSGSGGDIVYTGTNLVNYLQEEANGDDVASFALALTGNCGETTVIVRLYSKDQTTSPKPDLQIRDPDAVEMSSASAERVTWPLYAGLGAVALILVAGLAISRRRTA